MSQWALRVLKSKQCPPRKEIAKMVVPVLYCQLLNTQEHSKLFANTLKSSSECSGQMENRGVGNFVLSYIIS